MGRKAEAKDRGRQNAAPTKGKGTEKQKARGDTRFAKEGWGFGAAL